MKPKTKPTALRWLWDKYYIWILIWIMVFFLYFEGVKYFPAIPIGVLLVNAAWALIGHQLIYEEYIKKIHKGEITPFTNKILKGIFPNLFNNKNKK